MKLRKHNDKATLNITEVKEKQTTYILELTYGSRTMEF